MTTSYYVPVMATSGWDSHGITQYTWIDIVQRTFSETEHGGVECFNKLKAVVQEVRAMGSTSAGTHTHTHKHSLSLSLSVCVCVVTSGDVPYLYLRIAQLCDLIVVVMVVHVARPRNPGQTDAPVLACSPGQGPHQPPH